MKVDVDIALKSDLQAHQHPAHPRQPYAQAAAPVTEK